jgi:hypothetical protein
VVSHPIQSKPEVPVGSWNEARHNSTKRKQALFKFQLNVSGIRRPVISGCRQVSRVSFALPGILYSFTEPGYWYWLASLPSLTM